LPYFGGVGAKAFWAIKTLNFNHKVVGEKQLLQPYELDELRLEAYKNSRIYKERTKKWHDKHIMKKRFVEGDMVLLFNPVVGPASSY